jgi:hypothetical protein
MEKLSEEEVKGIVIAVYLWKRWKHSSGSWWRKGVVVAGKR